MWEKPSVLLFFHFLRWKRQVALRKIRQLKLVAVTSWFRHNDKQDGIQCKFENFPLDVGRMNERCRGWLQVLLFSFPYLHFSSLLIFFFHSTLWLTSLPRHSCPLSCFILSSSHIFFWYPPPPFPLTSLSFLFNLPLFRHHTSNLSRIRSSSQLLSPLGFFSPRVFDQRWPSRPFQRLAHQMPGQWCFVSQYNAIRAPQGPYSCPM